MTERGILDLRPGSVVTVGTFDGVHRGHRDIMDMVRTRAERLGLPSAVITFAPHPLAVVNPSAAPPLLTPGAERLAALVAGGAPDHAVVVQFTPAVAALTADQFVRVLIDRYAMRDLVVGFDHGLGRGRHGDVPRLRELGNELGFEVHVVDARTDGLGTAISSSAIRRAVAYGELATARRLLGRPYSMLGVVVHGSSRGRSIGVPTLNLSVAREKLLPPDGVYAVRVDSKKGSYGGMMNLGGRPTFGETARVPEVHLFDASGEWHGDSVWVEFVSRLRDTVRFAGVDELKAQLARDASAARAALTQA